MAELATLLTGYAGVVCAGEFAVVDWVTGLLPRTRWPLPVYLFAEGAAADSRPSTTIVLARRQRSARRLDFRTDRRDCAPMNGALPMAGALGVELAGEVFQAAVDLDGDYAVARAEPAGDADGGGEVGAGRWPGEYALGAGGLAGGLERLGFGNGHDFVVVGEMELGRAVADAAALDVMSPRRPA